MSEALPSHLFRLQQKRDTLRQRQQIIHAIHRYFQSLGFLEVSTPIRIAAPAPELNIDTEPCGAQFLIASPELQMKQMVTAGYDKIYQITKCFRQGEQGDRHLPEFTMLEWYETGATMTELEEHCMDILETAATAVNKYPTLSFGPLQISLDSGCHRLEVQDAFAEYAGWRPGGDPDALRFDMDLVEHVEPALPTNKPLFLKGYPASMASLAKLDPNNPERALRLEMYVGGLELANGFEELTDAARQRSRFEEEEQQRRALNKPPYPIDEQFLNALAHGMPDCAGMALGLDRLIMIVTDTPYISDVVTFSPSDIDS